MEVSNYFDLLRFESYQSLIPHRFLSDGTFSLPTAQSDNPASRQVIPPELHWECVQVQTPALPKAASRK